MLNGGPHANVSLLKSAYRNNTKVGEHRGKRLVPEWACFHVFQEVTSLFNANPYGVPQQLMDELQAADGDLVEA